MSEITAIEIQKNDKNRCNIYLDGNFFVGISVESVMKNHLKVGMRLDEKKLGEILYSSEKEKALGKALNYISKALKTRRQVKDYLIKKGYLEEVVFNVLDKLTENGLIDDKEYCVRYIETYSKNQGRKLIEFKLLSKGCKKEDILCAFENTIDVVNSCEHAYNLALKHLRGKELTKENYAKTYRYLVGKGFLFEDIDRAISIIKEEN